MAGPPTFGPYSHRTVMIRSRPPLRELRPSSQAWQRDTVGGVPLHGGRQHFPDQDPRLGSSRLPRISTRRTGLVDRRLSEQQAGADHFEAKQATSIVEVKNQSPGRPFDHDVLDGLASTDAWGHLEVRGVSFGVIRCSFAHSTDGTHAGHGFPLRDRSPICSRQCQRASLTCFAAMSVPRHDVRLACQPISAGSSGDEPPHPRPRPTHPGPPRR